MIHSSLKKMGESTGFSYVQQSVLTKLVCTSCKKYLSLPPIYTHPMQGSICGRCSVNNTLNYARNEIYELAIQYQKFPCIYQDSGCLENLFPSQVLEHEQRCFYKKIECPTKVANNCTWQGKVNQVLEHFERSHPTFILKACQFEVDFINNYSENYIMPYAEDIYVVKIEPNAKQNMLSLTVSYIGSNTEVDKFSYILKLESNNRDNSYTISQDIGKTMDISGDTLKKELQDPVIILAHIEIQDKSLTCGSSTKEIDKFESNKDNDKLVALECPVCLEYLLPPVYQCASGHSICHSCKETVTQCPTCKSGFTGTQNYALESIIENVIYPCGYDGCSFSTKSKYIKQHRESCLFGPFKCPVKDYENCSGVFSFFELFNHIKKQHYESLMELDTVSIPFDSNIKEDLNECYIIKHSSHLFKLCFMYNNSEGEFYWEMQLVGPREDVVKYKFDLELIDNAGRNNRLYIKSNCAPLKDKDNSFSNEEHFVYLDYDQVEKFIKNQLTYRIRIIINY